MRAKQRLYLTADREHIVLGAPKAAFLFKAVGQEISKAELVKYPEVKRYLKTSRPEVVEEKLAKKPLDKMKKPGGNK